MIKRLSSKVILNSLLLLVNMEKLSNQTNLQTMPEHKKTGILYTLFHLVWNKIRRLKKGSLFFIT